MRLEFEGAAPAPDEIAAVAKALQRFYSVTSATRAMPSGWRLAGHYQEICSIDELRALKLAPPDVL
jgi:hypothetical protein